MKKFGLRTEKKAISIAELPAVGERCRKAIIAMTLEELNKSGESIRFENKISSDLGYIKLESMYENEEYLINVNRDIMIVEKIRHTIVEE